jgi:hypothetical protein
MVFAATAAALLLSGAKPALAITGNASIIPTAQVEFTAGVKLGHLVDATTYMPSITVGGTFRVSCPSQYTGTIEGGNSLSQSFTWPPNTLTVGVPSGWLPAVRQLPGFNNVPAGTSLMCGYYWTAQAKESGYVLPVPGGGFPVGNETYNASDTFTFEMYKPGAGGTDDNNGCIR